MHVEHEYSKVPKPAFNIPFTLHIISLASIDLFTDSKSRKQDINIFLGAEAMVPIQLSWHVLMQPKDPSHNSQFQSKVAMAV